MFLRSRYANCVRLESHHFRGVNRIESGKGFMPQLLSLLLVLLGNTSLSSLKCAIRLFISQVAARVSGADAALHQAAVALHGEFQGQEAPAPDHRVCRVSDPSRLAVGQAAQLPGVSARVQVPELRRVARPDRLTSSSSRRSGRFCTASLQKGKGNSDLQPIIDKMMQHVADSASAASVHFMDLSLRLFCSALLICVDRRRLTVGIIVALVQSVQKAQKAHHLRQARNERMFVQSLNLYAYRVVKMDLAWLTCIIRAVLQSIGLNCCRARSAPSAACSSATCASRRSR